MRQKRSGTAARVALAALVLLAVAPPAGAQMQQQPPKPGCLIKGSVGSGGERVYHLPGGHFYNGLTIDPRRGERWFCSESEAQTAGWRRSAR